MSFFVPFNTFCLKFCLDTKIFLLVFSFCINVPDGLLPVFLISTFLTYFVSVYASYNWVLLCDVKKKILVLVIVSFSPSTNTDAGHTHSLGFIITFHGVLSVLIAFSSYYISCVCFVSTCRKICTFSYYIFNKKLM